MRGKWAKIWLTALIVTVSLTCAPWAANAADAWERGGMSFVLAGGQTPMAAQMLGEKPFQSRSAPADSVSGLLSDTVPSLHLDQDGGALIKLPRNLEMRISVLYNREPAPLELNPKRYDSMLMKYTLDYRFLPNLRVGLNGYLYRPEQNDNLSLGRPLGDRVMGLGPGIKYDLGRWSFMLKSQVETGNLRGNDLQNTVRVWYAF